MSATTVPRPTGRIGRPIFGRRRPSLFWVAAVVLAALTGLIMARFVAGAQQGAARWGEMRPTLVATTDLAPGTALGPADAEVRSLPRSVVPAAALDQLADGQVVAEPILAGEAVVADRLAPSGLSPTAAILDPGARGIAVPASAGLPLEVGDRVDVLVTFDPETVGDGEPTFPIARSAPVADVGEEAVTLSVSEEEAVRVAFALTAGVVTLTLDAGR